MWYLMLCSSQEDLDVRLGFDLCAQEQDFICKRKKVVAAALKDILQLEEDLQDDEVDDFSTAGCQNVTFLFNFHCFQEIGKFLMQAIAGFVILEDK